MSDLPDALPWPPGEENTQLALGHMYDLLRDMKEQFDRTEEKLDRLRPEIPPDRLYTYEEAGVRIMKGKDPDSVPEEDWGDGLSRTTVHRLVSDGDCPLEKTKIGGKVFVSEASMYEYKQALEDGRLPNYQRKHPRKS